MGEGYIKFKIEPQTKPERIRNLVHIGIVISSVALGLLVDRLGLRGGFGVVIGSMYILHWILPSNWTGTDKEKERPKLIGMIIGSWIYLICANLLFPRK